MSDQKETENKETPTRGERNQQTTTTKDKKKNMLMAIIAIIAVVIIAVGGYFIYSEMTTAKKMKEEAQQEQKIAESRNRAAERSEKDALLQDSKANQAASIAKKDDQLAQSADKQKETKATQSSAKADSSVDTKNLTQAQFEDWVKATVQKDDTMRNKTQLDYQFVAMNEEGNEFPLIKVVSDGKTIQTYRVNASGALQEKPEGQKDWQTVTRTFYE